jgi:zinc-finger binding domain of transposase IS66
VSTLERIARLRSRPSIRAARSCLRIFLALSEVLPCTPDQRVCKRCGKETEVIGCEESSQLDVEPAKYFVLVTKREKRACRRCATTDHREVSGE